MSDTQEGEGLSSAVAEQVTYERPTALAEFAASLRPRVAERHTSGPMAGRPKKYEMGHPDEIWLKVLQVNHSGERHTSAEWFAIIDEYRGQPAHPADPKFKREVR